MLPPSFGNEATVTDCNVLWQWACLRQPCLLYRVFDAQAGRVTGLRLACSLGLFSQRRHLCSDWQRPMFTHAAAASAAPCAGRAGSRAGESDVHPRGAITCCIEAGRQQAGSCRGLFSAEMDL
jgi:hypothetical protein